ncbi:NAD+ synthase [Phyllobacterium ifriqiyense]|uniref:NH(3)-dependent NAD(+) synthetase n=1 Tax=Phyllobacterium ifriqiyense TaxID=314238 RepID=A0ABU0S2L0_9HYPH|nr:NAD(+) synthase [Phyllobacterium ifriqiyense]MDQ0995011.1 NAD+ synthase [Phyllobacterium ifriqiyense]
MNNINPEISAVSPISLTIDPAAETERIVAAMREQLRHTLRRRGFVLGLSGGVDSSVCAALAARAVGAQNVLCIFMPENDSDPESLTLGRLVAETFGLASIVEDIGPSLEAMGCYERRDAFIKQIEPEFGPGWASKIVIANALANEGYNISSLVLQRPDGATEKLRMPSSVYLGIVAATNMKQRTRKQIEYYHADRMNYAVIGTPNLLEYDQGFFVKNGDGAADLKPIAHLYKSQVYQLAAYLGVPEEITSRPPTTDTYQLAQTQEEFYFALPYHQMDQCLYGLNESLPAAVIAASAHLSEDQVLRVWRDIRAKRKATRYLHLGPQLVMPIAELQGG